MKTILPILLLLIMASCARRPPAFAPVEPARPAPTGATQPTTAAQLPTTTAQPPTPAAQPPAPAQVAPPAVTPPPTPAATNAAVARVPGVLGATPTNAAAQTPIDINAPGPGLATPAAAEPVLAAGTIDFRNMPLEQALTVYAELVNKTLLRPAALPAQQITLTTQTPLTKSEAIQALKAVLALNGIAVVDFGDKFVKVVAEPQAGTTGAAIDARPASELEAFGSYVTHIVQLKFIKPSEAMPVLMPFARIPSAVLPIETSQILVLRDYTENVKRMLEMIALIDIAVPAEFISEVIPIKYAKASEIADALNSLGGGGSTTPIGRGTGAGTRPGAAGGARGAGGMPGAYGQGTTGYGTQGSFGGAGGVGGVGGVGGAGAGAGSITDRIQRIIQRASTSGDLQILGQTKMIADERSNSLLIFATRQDMDMIKTIVSKLDVVLSQVIIDSIIMDVSLSRDKALGFSAVQTPKNFNGDGSSAGAGGMNAQTFFSTFNNTAGGADTNVFSQLLGTGLRYFAKVDQNYLLQVQAAVSDGRVNVIQKPRILTSHATPGSIFVGSTVPYVTSTYYGGGYGGPSSSYQQLSVGIGLTVTPYINPDGLVVMQIDETIDELAGSTDIVGVGAVPNTTHRSLSAEIAVRDGDSIILGGFIRNANTTTKSGVPILMDIPLLGNLFSTRTSSKDRKELLVLMRPTVLKTPDIAALTSTQEKSRMPGIANAEAEAMAEQQQEMDKLQKKLRSHPTPVPPPRTDIYGNPQPSQY